MSDFKVFSRNITVGVQEAFKRRITFFSVDLQFFNKATFVDQTGAEPDMLIYQIPDFI
jgi:hypothetical protein